MLCDGRSLPALQNRGIRMSAAGTGVSPRFQQRHSVPNEYQFDRFGARSPTAPP